MKIRTAVVGLGWVATRVWLPLLGEHPAFQVTALVEPDDPSAEAASPLAPDAKLVGDVADLSDDVLDLALVATPNHLHASIAEALLARNISVFVEKPVCLRLDEVERLRVAERHSGARLFASSAARMRADVAALQELLGSVGTPRLLELEWTRARGVPRQGGWFTRRDLSGGGALVDLGWHLLDLGLALLDWPRIADVAAVTSSDFIGRGDSAADWRMDRTGHDLHLPDVEDTAAGLLVTERGTAISLRASWASHEPYDVTRIAVHGSDGAATLRSTFGFSPNRVARPTLTLRHEGRLEEVPLAADPLGAEYRRQLDALVRLLGSGEAAAGRAIDESAAVLKAVWWMYRAARPARLPAPP